MSELFKISKRYKARADQLLKKTGLIGDLGKYGEVHLTGAYAADMMMHGDIDIEVVKGGKFSQKEIFEIFKKLYLKDAFKSLYLKGRWDDPRLGQEFPDGQYMGAKTRLDGERWTIDMWFVGKKEAERRKRLNSFINEKINGKNKELILRFKKFRNENGLSISGYEIYEAVLKNEIGSMEKLKRFFSK